MNEYLLEIQNITKTFPGVKALDNVTLKVKKGEIHAIAGENGAGKSTLIKILYGLFAPDSGRIVLEDTEVIINTPKKAAQLGISIIFQELNLIPTLTVAENIFVGRLQEGKNKLINWSDIREKARTMLNKLGYDINPRKLVSELSVAEKQMVEIAKALTYDAKIILMDEPSATLTDKELEVLFNVIKDLKKNNVSVIYISHRLDEIFKICDRVTVLRDGMEISTNNVSDITRDDLIRDMVGREIRNTFPKIEHDPKEEIFRVEDLVRSNVVKNVSFSLRRGEILGIAGLVGSGRSETARIIFGADYFDSGKIFIKGEEVKIKDPATAIKRGLAFLTEDRKKEGLILNFTVRLNITMTNIKSIMNRFFLCDKLEKSVVADMIKQFNIRTYSMNQKVNNLSGGNQQKIVVSKWLNTKADILIFDEPTRGIDVGAKYEMYLFMNEFIKQGKSIILISSELPEVLALSNRVLVMHKGEIRAELTGEDISAENVMKNAV